MSNSYANDEQLVTERMHEHEADEFVPFARDDIEQSIVARFEQQAACYPKHLAVSDGRAALSYDDLNRHANRIAREISSRVEHAPPSRIVVCLEKGADCVAAILAVLKVGYAYVPLDPDFPASRNQSIVLDTQPALLITNTVGLELAHQLAGGTVPVTNLDDIPTDVPDHNLDLDISPDSMAYVIYTSGSTGKPKGVMQNHRNTLHGCWRRTQLQGIRPSDRVTLFYSCSVMGSVYCIFGALLNGASLFCYDICKDGLDHLGDWLRQHRITVYHSVASLFRRFSAIYEGPVGTFKVRLVILGGESVLVADIEQARRVFSDRCEFFTGLGSTETGTIRHLHIGPDTSLEGAVVPVGYAVEDMEVLLLDDEGAPVPPGQVGEIAVHSQYLALGYWNDEEATNRVFGPADKNATGNSGRNARRGQTGRRLYHTGDMGCMSENGLLEHRGRKDYQVNIRGFRVEIGEVESALLDHPPVKQAVVVAREDTPDDKRLVAYLILEGSAELDSASLRAGLRRRLPEYMVPSVLMQLTKLPLTPNGKIDRQALPVPEDCAITTRRRALAANEVEERLIEIFEDALKNPVTSRTDSFFDLGGHSLSALSVATSINRRFGVDIPPLAVFSYPTIQDLAAFLTNGMNGDTSPVGHGASPIDAGQSTEVDEVLASVDAVSKRREVRTTQPCPKMRESWLARHVLARLYAYPRRSVRRLLTRLILKLEGGKTFSVTMRKLFAKHHQIEIGDFTAVLFDVNALRRRTKIGRYCSIYPTAVFQNADHPRNALSTHALFYARSYGFTPGYELDRMKIEIGNDVWIGNGAKILYPTKKIGDGAVIAADAVVIEDVPPYAIVGGYPAQIIRYRFSQQTIVKLLELRWWDRSLEELQSVRDEFMKPLEGDRIR